ncbi:hypothetical protein GCM10009557_67250 [Virgisporangium ochraceum]|uniref:Uncharacterized protein n=1 Tax=Virgisporangium ochraceum TaxID=65505 RepID=A0A8J3ZT46_9ACTN|nr:hypothetical protein [Virgisporangium ochraceum]GIJ68512.1 hypothetical protein Voc01_034290 [Virgisporangium ochraceum]
MPSHTAADVFTDEEPLGPTAIPPGIDLDELSLLHDPTASPNRLLKSRSPTFIVGRRGSGKTSLLLWQQQTPYGTSVQLRTDAIFSRVSAVVNRLRRDIVLTEEGVADVWNLLLWGPVAMRLLDRPHPDDPRAELSFLWEELKPLREAVRDEASGELRGDDIVLDLLADRLAQLVGSGEPILGADKLYQRFRVLDHPWTHCIRAAREIMKARRATVCVLIDSLENIGPGLETLTPTLRGLFHLVGRIGTGGANGGYRLRCCFPSELWPLINRISANPLKDFAQAMTLRWSAADLLHAANARLTGYLRQRHPQLLTSGDEPLQALLPRSVVNRLGVTEPTVSYMLRHTQLLPRQFIHILNRALHRAIVARGTPAVRPEEVLDAVAEVEAILCPEVFASYGHQFPDARAIAHRLLPNLPFRFDDSFLHQMCNRAGIRRSYGVEYPEVREMLAQMGIIGRFRSEDGYYLNAEFEYTVEGSLNLAPEDVYCLHPMFVRECKSRDVRLENMGARPVYPAGTPTTWVPA